MKSLLLFMVLGLLFGTVALVIGYALWADDGLIQGGTAFALTFVPSMLTLAWTLYSYRTTPEMQLMSSLGGSGVRMAIALGGGFLLTQAQPKTFDPSFWFWILVFYMTFLAAEITLIVWQQRKPDQTAPV